MFGYPIIEFVEAKLGLVVAHPEDGWSMKRYSKLIISVFEKTIPIYILQNTNFFSRYLGKLRIKKVFVYFEKFWVGFLLLNLNRKKFSFLFIANHSDAWVLNFSNKPAIVVCHDTYAIFSARGLVNEHETKWTGKIYQNLILRGLSRAKLVICVSEKTEILFKELLPNVHTKLILNPLDPDFVKAIENKNNYLDSKKKYCLVVMNSNWRKNRILNIEAWARIRSFEPSRFQYLIIIGEKLNRIEREYLEINGLVEFVQVLNGLTNDRLVAYYKNSQLLINITRFEGFGWPVIEANAVGVLALHGERYFQEQMYHPFNVLVEDMSKIDVVRKLSKSETTKLIDNTILKFSFDNFVMQLNRVISEF